MIEDLLPEHFKIVAFKPNAFTYSWRKNNIEKLFEELMSSNIAILGGVVWVVEGSKISEVIQLKNGDMKLFNWKIAKEKNEEWFDFVERSIKESLNLINHWNLEKTVRNDLSAKIHYSFKLEKK